MRRWRTLLALLCLLLSACGGEPAGISVGRQSMSPAGSMELQYAKQFAVDYYGGGSALVTIAGTDRYLVLPEGAQPPAGLDEDVAVLCQPLNQIYVAASSAMDLFLGLDALDQVRMTSTAPVDWSLPEVGSALESGALLYVGKYRAPDYELILDEGCTLAVESTMIYHSPQVMETLESLGVPVLVERSSYESHPLGRLEWIKLYGLLTGREEEAAAFFDGQAAALAGIASGESTGKTVAFFYITNTGAVNIRKPGDYISKMIELAGGEYLLGEFGHEEEASLSTMNIQMEAFYAAARDTDVLIYSSTVDGEMFRVEQLLEKSPLLADFKAVQEGNVWCTGRNMFQKTTGTADMVADLHTIVTGEADGENQLTFLHRLT